MKDKTQGAHSGYHWIIFCVCFLWELVFMSLTLADSVYVVPVTQALGFSRAQFTMIFSIRSVVQLIGNVIYGKLYSRVGVKPLMTIGSVCMVAGYLLYSQATALWLFYLSAVIVGIAMVFMSASSLTIILNSWFDKSAGVVFGIVFTGSSIGGAAISSLMGRAIASVGYSNAYRITALLALVSAVPVLLFTREQRGAVAQTNKEVSKESMSFRQFLSSRTVRAGLLLCFAIGLTVYPLEACISAHLTDRGFPAAFGAGILGASLLFSALGKMLLGMLYDRRGLNSLVLTGATCFVAGAVLFVFVDSIVMAWIFAFVFGLSIANITTVSPFLTKGILSPQDYGKYIGVFTAVIAAGNTIGFSVMNSLFDRLGTYTPTVLVQVVIFAVAAIWFCYCNAQQGKTSRK